jgi:hypothetical protein
MIYKDYKVSKRLSYSILAYIFAGILNILIGLSFGFVSFIAFISGSYAESTHPEEYSMDPYMGGITTLCFISFLFILCGVFCIIVGARFRSRKWYYPGIIVGICNAIGISFIFIGAIRTTFNFFMLSCVTVNLIVLSFLIIGIIIVFQSKDFFDAKPPPPQMIYSPINNPPSLR